MVHVTATSSLLTIAALVAVAASPVEGVAFNCPGINYNIRAGADWAAPEVKCKSGSQIASELDILKSYTNVLRLYSLTDCDQATALVPAAIAAGFQLELGLWVDSYASSYSAEKEAFATLLDTGVVTPGNIVGIHVGSEALYRGDVDYRTAVSHLSEIRQMCIDNGGAAEVPLTITDVGNTYLAYPSLIDEVDYVSANLFPYWDRVVPAKAASYFLATYERLVELAATRAGEKRVVIGETGWATNGTDARASVATPENAARYFHDFYLQAQEKGITYYYFSAFDEPWKGTDTVEAYFGLFHEDGKLKATIEGLELDNETADTSEAGSTQAEAVASRSNSTASSNATNASGSATEEVAFETVGESKTDEPESTVAPVSTVATVTSDSASGAAETSSSDAGTSSEGADTTTVAAGASQVASNDLSSSSSFATTTAPATDCAMI